MNAIAKDIRVNRQKFENIVNDFRAYWGKVYRNEVTKYLDDIKAAQQNDPKNESIKAERYAIEQVCARIKGLTLSDEIRDLIRTMHNDDKLTFSCLTTDYIIKGLSGLDYVNGQGELCEFRKASKDATEKSWCPIEKWTEAKVGRYFRLATIRINEESK